jgi:hypothetical protein
MYAKRVWCEDVDRIHPTWQAVVAAVVNTAMNTRVLQEVENFLTRSVTIGFSMTTIHYLYNIFIFLKFS